MSVVTEALTTDQIHDLWGSGFTIVKRPADPFELLPGVLPGGWEGQWCSHPDMGNGWVTVNYEDHPGYLGPYGATGPVAHGGLWLHRKLTEEVTLAKAKSATAAKKLVDDWAGAAADHGFTGGARVVGFDGDKARVTEVKIEDGGWEIGAKVEMIERPKEKTIEMVSLVPKEMFPHMSEIFAERDRLKDQVVMPDRRIVAGPIADKFYAAIDADKSLPWWPTLHAILLPIAIENVRVALKNEQEKAP